MKGSDGIEVDLDVQLDAKGVWPGLRKEKGVKILEGAAELAAIWTTEGSTRALGTVVAMRVNLGGGRVAIAEVTLASFLSCAAKVRAHYEGGAVASNVTEEQLDKMGRLVDRIDNFVQGSKLPVSDRIHATALAAAMTDLHAELKTLYVEIAGEDPWAEIG